MKNIILSAAILIVATTSCKVLSVNYRTLPPEIALEDSAATIVVVDAAEVHTPGLVLTKKREEVVTAIKQDYITHLPAGIHNNLGTTALFDTTLSNEEKILLLNDNTAVKEKLLNRYHAGMIIVLRDCAGGFTQEDIVNEKNTDGSTSKKAYYAVFFQTQFHIIQKQRSWNKEVLAKRKHSSRSVLSGLLARGPGYAANRKDIAAMARENAIKTASLFKEQKIAVGGWEKN